MTEHSSSANRKRDDELRRTCEILESIASRFEPASPEHQAIREAASAYTFVHQRRALLSAYQNRKQAGGGELTPQMAEVLRSMGLDPDEADEESAP
jgi:hypothetical protein